MPAATQYQQGRPQCPPRGFGAETTRARGPGLLPGDETPAAVGSESTNQGNTRGRPLCTGWEALLWCPRQTGGGAGPPPWEVSCHPRRGVLLEDDGFPAFGAWLPPEGADTHQSPCGAAWAVQPRSTHRVGAQPAGGGRACSPARAASESSQPPQGMQSPSLSLLCSWDSSPRAGPGRQEPLHGARASASFVARLRGPEAESRFQRVCVCAHVSVCVCLCV